MKDRYRFNVGDVHCLAINDGHTVGNAALLFPQAPDAELLPLLAQQGLDPEHLPSTWTCLLLYTPTERILVDTGFGAGGAYGGQLLPILREEGIAPEEIDRVILTHGHADHIGGCVDAEGRVIFARATHYMWHSEWAFWTAECELEKLPDWAASMARRQLPPLAPQLVLLDEETEIRPGICVLPAPGHTVGHIALEIASRGETCLDIGDAALHPVHVAHPEWVASLDQLPEQTVATRRALYERASERQALVLGYHFHPFPSLGHIARQDGQWRWIARRAPG